jgi:hypothetical protein
MKKWMRFVNVLAVAGLMAIAGRAARADIQIPGDPTVMPLGGGLFEYQYDVYVATNERIETGNYFTIFDFAEFELGSQSVTVTPSTGGTWTPSYSLTGAPPHTLPVGAQPGYDSAALYNLTWTYAGGDVTPGSYLGLFTAVSRESKMTSGEYSGVGTKHAPGSQLDGNDDPNLDTTIVPGHAPEPGTMALLGLGGAGMVAKLRRRRRTDA